MKISKAKSALFTFSAAALAAALCAMFGATGAVASAESGEYARQGENFIYSAEFVPEAADFRNDFTTEAGGAWKYGYIEDGGYDWGNNTFTFHELTADAGAQAWKVDDGTAKIEVKSDFFSMDKGFAAIGYEVGAGVTSSTVSVNYKVNDDPNSRFTTRILVLGPDGASKFWSYREEGKTNAEWTVDENMSVAEGDTIYVVMFREDGWNQGKLQITISLPGSAGFGFGEKEDSGYAVTAKDGKIGLYQTGETQKELKAAAFPVAAGEKFALTLVVNDGVAKVYHGKDNAALLVCKLNGYTGGAVKAVSAGSIKITNENFFRTDTPEGHIYVGGYTVDKVVNLTDGNYKLSSDEFTEEGGVVTVEESYLKTLEAGAEYKFRVVTSFTDFNFTVTTDFTSVSAAPAVDKYYKDGDVAIELSGDVTVTKVLIDGKACEFEKSASGVVIPASEVSGLSVGSHTVKLFTDKGRPEVSINVTEKVETVTDPIVEPTRLFFWIDIAIFGVAIVGYLTYTIIKKRKGK